MGVIKPTVRPNLGGLEYVHAHGNMGATETIDLANGNVHTGTLDANCTLTFSGAVSGFSSSFELILTQDGTGSRTVTWPGSVTWPAGGTPVLATAAGSVDVFIFETTDGGTAWRGLHVTRVVGAYSGNTWTTGTSMPGSPAANQRVTRTDLGMDFYYDGTRWLSTTLYHDPVPLFDSVGPFSATTTSPRIAQAFFGVSDVWLVRLDAAFFVDGGTALGASHKWVLTLKNAPAGSTVATINIDSGASSTWRQSATNIGASSASTVAQFHVDATKTGTPGNLYLALRLSWRRIGT